MALTAIQVNNKLIKFREEILREFVRRESVFRVHGQLADVDHSDPQRSEERR